MGSGCCRNTNEAIIPLEGTLRSSEESDKEDPNSWKPGVSSPILLLWITSQTPLLTRLSSNISREICSYLSGPKRPVALFPGIAKFFDLVSGLSKDVKLSQEIEMGWIGSVTNIGMDQVFVCMVETYVIEARGEVHQLQGMRIYHQFHGAVYLCQSSTVYVFGGLGGNRKYKESEQFLFQSGKWKLIADMIEARARFNPCTYADLIYLCGGGPLSIEIYNPKTNSYSLLPDLTLKKHFSSLAVVESEVLIILTGNSVSKWKFKESAAQTWKIEAPYDPWSSCAPVVKGKVVYIVQGKTCRGYSLETGIIKEEVQ